MDPKTKTNLIEKVLNFMLTVAVYSVILTISLMIACNKESKGAIIPAADKDWFYLDSTFRAMEKRPGGASVDFKNRIFTITKPVTGCRVTDGSAKVFTIDNLIVKGSTLSFAAVSLSDAQIQTGRTLIFHSLNIYNADVGLIIQGSHRSYLENVSLYSCRKGASLEFCLEGKALNLQEHLCKDTGVYIGWCRNLPGATNYNSQSNNFCINGLRSFGLGSEIGFIFESVSGCNVTSLTNEGSGCKIFLKVTAANSTVMKDFHASGFHIECDDTTQIYCIQAILNGGSRFTFENFYCQVPLVLADASGGGVITIRGIVYHPYNPGYWKGSLKLSSGCPGDGGTVWVIDDCLPLNNHQTWYDDFFWVKDQTHCKPIPFNPGQITTGTGSQRLKEIPAVAY